MSTKVLSRMRRNTFPRIDTRDDALLAVKNGYRNFYGLALLQMVVSLFFESPTGPYLFFGGLVLFLLADALREYRSRVASFLLLTIGILALVGTLASLNSDGGSAGIVVVIIFLLVAIKSFEASLKLHGIFQE